MDERVEKLEIKVSFQDDTIQSLSDTVARQDREIVYLKQELDALKNKLKDINAGVVKPEEEETPPPHY